MVQNLLKLTRRWGRVPAGINASSLPARDRGYVVGDHGMVYRYRIVPIDRLQLEGHAHRTYDRR